VRWFTDPTFQLPGGGGFDDIDPGKQRGRHVGQVGLGIDDALPAQKLLAVQRDQNLGQAANVDGRAFARRAADLDAGDALQAVGDGAVGKLADVFGHDAVDDLGGAALDVDGGPLRPAHAQNDDIRAGGGGRVCPWRWRQGQRGLGIRWVASCACAAPAKARAEPAHSRESRRSFVLIIFLPF
jgi:hypothetical protein